MKRLVVYGSLLLLIVACYLFRDQLRAVVSPILRMVRGHYTVQQRVEQYGQDARNRWRPYFEAANLQYPPEKLLLLGLKAENFLEVYAKDSSDKWKFVREFPVCAASGTNGPKLKEGDLQVPEGIYRISFLNANSLYHLSMRVNYPNEYDRKKGREDGRTDLGGDIMIHGNCVSIGCLAMRDEAAEDLFVLSAEVGIQNSTVLLAPFDFRSRSPGASDFEGLPTWTPELYDLLQKEFDKLPIKRET